MRQPDRDIETAIDDLTHTLRELRDEVGRPPRPPRRPPAPRDLLRFTEQRAIPAAIAVLEANVRALELLAAAIRLADGRVGDEAEALPARAREASRTTLDHLDAALADLQAAIEGGEPSNPEARRLLRQARALREEIDDRLREAGERGTDGPTIIPVGSDEDEVAEELDAVDVESELGQIREEVDREREDEDDEP